MAVRHGYGKVAGTDALVFAYDTGDTRNSYRGEPTTNLLGTTGDMAPPNPDTPYDLTTATSVSNVNSTTWGLSLYPATNLAADNGVAWDPYIKGPGFTGAWKLKKRPGGNGETQFQNGYGSVSNATAITISVWCRCEVAGVARINTNTTRNGSSYWGYSSGYHTGDGTWQKLTLVIPAGSGVTSINVVRCQVNGTTVNTDVYWRHYQIEYNTHATQFTAGTRSATQGLLDLTGNSTIDLSNVSFDSNAQITFDGTNDYVDLSSATSLLNLGSTFSIEGVFKLDNTSQEFGTVFSSLDVATGTQTKGVGFYWKKTAEYGMSANTIRLQLGLSAWSWHIFASNGISISDTNYHHVAVTLTGGSTNYPTIVFYIDGVAQAATKWTAGSIGPINNSSNANSLRLGSIYTASNSSYNNFYSAELLDVVKIYNRVLTAQEVRNNYNFYKGRFGM